MISLKVHSDIQENYREMVLKNKYKYMTLNITEDDILIDKKELLEGSEWKNLTDQLLVNEHKLALVNLDTKSADKFCTILLHW